MLERRKQQTASGYTRNDLLIRKAYGDICITYFNCCESGGTSVEALVMRVEQQPLVGWLYSLNNQKDSFKNDVVSNHRFEYD